MSDNQAIVERSVVDLMARAGFTFIKLIARSFIALAFIALTLKARPICADEPALPRLVFSEVHYNPSGKGDLQGEFIELFNPGSKPLDVSGWKIERGVRFTFSKNTMIGGGAFVVIARMPDFVGALHGIEAARLFGPFEGKLSNFADRLRLVDGEGAVVDELSYEQDGLWPARADGRGGSLQRVALTDPERGPRNWIARAAPTPGKAAAVTAPSAPPLIVSVERSPIEPAPGDSVRLRARVLGTASRIALLYDLGGGELQMPMVRAREVKKTGGTNAPKKKSAEESHEIWEATLPPTSPGSIVRFRLVAFVKDGAQPGGSVNTSLPREGNPSSQLGYFVSHAKVSGGEEGQPHASPVARNSESLDVFHLFWTGRLSCSRGRWRPGVFVHRGTAFLDVRVKYRGQTSCGAPKSGLKIAFNQGALFRGQERLNLLAGWQDRSLLREFLGWGLFRDAGHPHCEAKMAAVYDASGAFHGLYVGLEEPGSRSLRRQKLEANGSLWKCFSSLLGNSASRRFRLMAGEDAGSTSANARPVREFERAINTLEGAALREYLTTHFDIESFLDYQAIKCLLSDEDGYSKNYLLHRRTRAEERGGRLWTVHPWDLDLSFGQLSLFDDGLTMTKHPLAGTIDHPRFGSHGIRWSGITEAVLGRRSEDWFVRALYGRIWRLLDEKFSPLTFEARVDRIDGATAELHEADLARWPRWSFEVRDAEAHRERLRQYARGRHAFLRRFLANERPTSAKTTEPWPEGVEIETASGIVPERATSFRTFAYKPLPRVKISEIHYNPKSDEALEFIVLKNLEKKKVDLSAWDIPAVGFVFPKGSALAAKGSLVVARDPTKLGAAFPDLARLPILGPWNGKLANDGENLRLRDSGRDADGKASYPETVDLVPFRDNSRWPEAADGDGASLELHDLKLDNDLPTNWRARKRG